MATVTSAAGSVATIESLTTENKTFYEMVLLDRAIANFYYCAFAKEGNIPPGKGGTIEWRKFSALSAATTPLTEGVTPGSEGTSVVNYTATPLHYGAYIRHSDELDLIAIDDVTAEYSAMLGEQAGLTADTLARALFVASGTAQIGGSQTLRTSLTTSELFDGLELAEAWATLVNYNARGWDFLGGRFAVIMSPKVWVDFIRDAEVRNAVQEAYPRSEDHPFWNGEVFDYMNCRFFLTSQAYYETDGGSSTTDAYITLVIGRDAFGIAGIGAEGFRPDIGEGGTGSRVMPVSLINMPLGSEGSADPLKQRASIGWEGWQQEVELDATWAVRVETACSLGSN